MSFVFVFLLIVLGLIFIGSVLLQNPKGGLGFAIGGLGHANEYGSKKSLETTLKKVSLYTAIAFVFIAVVFPFALSS